MIVEKALSTFSGGELLGHYRILEQVGAGGMGHVYRAHDEHLDCDVAIKVLAPGAVNDEIARKRFHKEARALSRLSHPNIAVVHDFDSQRGLDFLVMEFISGISLSEKIAGRPLLEKDLTALGIQLADGLWAAHERGVVHSDLKPGNLRVTADGRLKILDFGLARLRLSSGDTEATQTSSAIEPLAGTLPYMAPEQLRGGVVDRRTDLYAAGCILYEMATGKRPFAGVERTVLADAILHLVPPPPAASNPTLSLELTRIIGKCLEKDADNRYQSARELAIDLRRLQFTTDTLPQLSVEESKRSRWRIPILLTLLVAFLLAIPVRMNVDGGHSHALTPANIRSLLVLPFTNLSRDSEQEYFAQGIAEALTTRLSQIEALRVLSSASAIRYKNTDKRLPQIAQEVKVDGVLVGSVEHSGKRVRINAQLIHGPTETQVWAASYDREMPDVLELESDVASAIVNELQVSMTLRQKELLTSAPKVNPEAYESYLRGRYEWNKRTEDGLQRGIKFFEKSLALDPKCALAYVGLADSYFALAYSAEVVRPRDAIPIAETAIQNALKIDSSLAEAHTTLGAIRFFYDLDWKAAGEEFRRAIALNPGYATAHHWYGLYLGWTGHSAEARSELLRAQELDPLSSIISTNLAATFALSHQFERAIEQLQRTIEFDSGFWLAYWDLGADELALGRYSEGITHLQKAVDSSGGSAGAVAMLGYAYGVAGQRQKAEQTLQQLRNIARNGYVSPAQFAIVEFGLGRVDQAFVRLQEAYDERSGILVSLKTDPLFDRWRSDPRFVDLLRRLKFED